MSAPEADGGAEGRLLAELEPAAFAVAYRMLGSVADAEEVVQESLLRFHRAREGGEEIASPRAYVTTVAARLAIDGLRSARVRRETYAGEWLPEPLLAERPAEDDPAAEAELADSLSIAFLRLLEQLTPEQRAALLLHDVSDYSYGEVAAIVGRSEENARQLASRARRRVEAERPRFETSREDRDELAWRFFAAAREGDVAGLEALLAEDVVLHGDGGGKVPALAHSLTGARRIARTLVNWGRAMNRIPGTSIEAVEVNGLPGAFFRDPEGRIVAVMAIEIGDGAVTSVSSVVNPEKLAHLGPVGDLGELLKSSR